MWKTSENVKKVFQTDGRLCRNDWQRVEFEHIIFVFNVTTREKSWYWTSPCIAGNLMLSKIAENGTVFHRHYITFSIVRCLTGNRMFLRVQSIRLTILLYSRWLFLISQIKNGHLFNGCRFGYFGYWVKRGMEGKKLLFEGREDKIVNKNRVLQSR